jgi:hypothetical protein
MVLWEAKCEDPFGYGGKVVKAMVASSFSVPFLAILYGPLLTCITLGTGSFSYHLCERSHLLGLVGVGLASTCVRLLLLTALSNPSVRNIMACFLSYNHLNWPPEILTGDI